MDNEPGVGSFKDRRQQTVFPWCEDVWVSLWQDGPEYYPRLLSLIDQSRSFIFLELYWFSSGRIGARFVEAFCAASRRGVNVYCLLDHIGSRDLSHSDRNRLRSAGVRLLFYNPVQPHMLPHVFKRDHRKVWVFDGQVALLGGPGVADPFMGSESEPPWRDVLFELQGSIVKDFVEYFKKFWITNGGGFFKESPFLPIRQQEGQARWPVEQARLVLSWGVGQQHVKRSGLKQIRSASSEIVLVTGYFYPAWKLRRALREAAQRGVRVKLLLPGTKTDHPIITEAGRYYYRYLLKHGVEIFEYLPRFQHVKLLLCDDWVSFGSSNQDRWNQRWNLEANVEAQGKELAEALRGVLDIDFSNARSIEWDSWRKRSWWRRFKTYLIYRLTLIVESWFVGRN